MGKEDFFAFSYFYLPIVLNSNAAGIIEKTYIMIKLLSRVEGNAIAWYMWPGFGLS